MQTVIFAIDRDNDFGEKLGLKGPIIGRRANLKAAVSMGLEDPEESDMNALFAAIKLYDQLKGEGEDVEVVTLLGDDRIGIWSDRALAKNLETFLKDHEADEAIVVTDGAEDEQILPIIQSRISVSSVQRCIVKQSETAESTYYILKRTFEEERIAQKIFVPIFLIMIVYALFAFTEYGQYAWYAILLAVGIYGLLYFVNASELMSEWYRRTKVSIVTSQISFFSNIVAAVMVILGGIFALDQTVDPGSIVVFNSEAILVFTGLATIGLTIWLLVTRRRSVLLHVALGMVLAGALGNLYDRFHWHKVRDFFLVYLGELEAPSWKWPNFNVADALIVVGVIFILLHELFGRRPSSSPLSFGGTRER